MLHWISIYFNDCYMVSTTYITYQCGASCSERTDPMAKSAVLTIRTTGLTSKFLHAFMYGSENKQRLFHCKTLSDVSIIEKESVYYAVRAEYLNI